MRDGGSCLRGCPSGRINPLMGIISDRRMVNCVNRMGDGSIMLLKIALSSVGMFVIQVAVITYTTSGRL
jgi:hypothetical protein